MNGDSGCASMAEREAELAALQSAFDEYITSSRELEEELDSELAKMQDKLADSMAANAAFSSQIENMVPQLYSLEKALSEAKTKLQNEIELRRKEELLADDYEGRNRELESSLRRSRDECDTLHEALAFKESELEETKLELEVEKERHRVDLFEIRSISDTAQRKVSLKGTSEEDGDFGDAKIAGTFMTDIEGDLDDDVKEESLEYVKSLEEELELVTEQLIETEKHLRKMQEKLVVAEKNMTSKDDKYATEKDYDFQVKINKDEVIGNLREENRMLQEELAGRREEIELTKEEILLTQEELKIAEVDKTRIKVQLDTAQSTLKQQIFTLQEKLDTSEINASAALKEVETLESTLEASNNENITLKDEISNLHVALKNVKNDNSSLLDELGVVNSRFDEVRNEAEKAGYDEAVVKVKEKMKALHETELNLLERKIRDLAESKTVLQQKLDDSETSVANARDFDVARQTNEKSELVIKLKDHLSRWKKEAAEKGKQNSELKSALAIRLSQAESYVSLLEKELSTTKGKLAEAEANLIVIKREKDRALPAMPRSHTNKLLASTSKVGDETRDDDDDNDSGPRSEFAHSHALTRRLATSEGDRRRSRRPCTRSLSPTTRQRLEYEIVVEDKKEKHLEIECEKLKEQNRMGIAHSKRLEEDLKVLQMQVFGSDDSDALIPTQLSRISTLSQKTSNDFDLCGSMLTGVDEILTSDNPKFISDEFKMLDKKYKLQRDYNAALLSKILGLQGNIQVCCRVRPMKMKEIEQGQKNVVEVFTETEVGCLDQRTNKWKSFVFDKVWSPDQDQHSIFSDVEPIALSVVDGYNACIFAYGQTGSGKTYTMEGIASGNQYGISYRTIQKILNLMNLRVQQQKAASRVFSMGKGSSTGEELKDRESVSCPAFNFSLEVGMLEIYNDDVYDLLIDLPKGATTADKKKGAVRASGKATLDIRQNANGQIDVPGLTKEPVKSIDDVMALLKRGNSNRATASTDLNEHSSRSHMVLSVEVVSGLSGHPGNNGTLFLVDLAGSERVRKSNVVGDQLKEAGFINKSLSALGNVMEALDRKASHVPYRDSKLTYLLQNSLGGNSRTMMVLAVCPMDTAFDESVHALSFATRVRRIQIGAAQRNATSRNLEEKVKSLTAEMKRLTKSKEKSEMQLQTLKRDNIRIQERLHHISESRKASQVENKTLEVLRKNNAEMANRWQREKTIREKTSIELESCQTELKRTQSDNSKATREKESLLKKLSEKEESLEKVIMDLKEAKEALSAATIRARKAEIMSSRVNALTSNKSSTFSTAKGSTSLSTSLSVRKQRPAPGITAPTKTKIQTLNNGDVDIHTIRSKVLALLEKYDKSKVGRIDIIMEKFKGKETLLLEKMTHRYEGRSCNKNSTSTSAQAALMNRSELALERHKERMKLKKACADKM